MLRHKIGIMSTGKRSRSITSKSLTQSHEVNSKYVTEKIDEAINALKKSTMQK